jgi:hypothetical protein
MQLSFSEGQRIDLLLLQCSLVQSMLLSMVPKARHCIPLQCPKRPNFNDAIDALPAHSRGNAHGECCSRHQEGKILSLKHPH